MHSFHELAKIFEERFSVRHFPGEPATLYEAGEYILQLGGKRIRPVICLMGNEIIGEIVDDAYHIATAIELFHNFTLIHDDIMDKAPLRRGLETVHTRYGESTALLSGDVMLVRAYDYLNKVNPVLLSKVIRVFNTTAREVCEGQQLDMDYEQKQIVSMDDYLKMISLKTSVLLAASLKLGALIGGAGEGNQQHLYEFGMNLGMAFQVQDDYLDAFGEPSKFGKQTGGDILANKKTFLTIHAHEVANESQVKELKRLLSTDEDDKVNKVLQIFRDCKVESWAMELKEKYLSDALSHLHETAIVSVRKKPLEEFAEGLIHRES